MIQLVKQAMKSDAGAFLELMECNSGAMYKVARSILKNDDDVADAIQNTILICFEKLHTLQKPQYFKTWMTRILINECNKILQYYREVSMPEQFPEYGQQDMSFAEFEFKEMLEKVDEKYRTVLVLYYVEGFKISEIAEILDMKENTVKTRLTRAREQLRLEYMERKPDQIQEKRKNVSSEGGVSDEKANRVFFSKRYTVG